MPENKEDSPNALTGPIRDEKGRYVKGSSYCGNPAGRKPMPNELKEIFKGATVEAAKFLVHTIGNLNEKTENRIRASEIVLDRVYGKPKQSVEGTIETNVSNTIDLSGLSIEKLLFLAAADPKKLSEGD
jgi:hypothetical protein